jgi:PKD repeat protein
LAFKSIRRLNLESEFQQLEAGTDPFRLKRITRMKDKTMNTLLNKDNTIQIGDVIYLFKTKDYVIKIANRDESTFAAILAGKSPLTLKNVTIVSGTAKPAGNEPCEIDFSFSSNVTGNTVSFSIIGTPVAGTTYNWNFGDGQTSTQANPTHTYANQGMAYSVTLSINRGDTCYATKTYNVTVNEACVAFFSQQEIPNLPGGMAFHSLSTAAAGTITSWAWTFGDGGTGTGANANHTYTCDGTFQVTLTIVTSTGCTRTFSKQVTIASIHCCDHDIDVNQTIFTYNTPDGQHKLEGNAEDWQPVVFWWVHNMNAELHHWKKKSNGGWKKENANMKVEFLGNVYTKNATGCTCMNPISIVSDKSQNAKKVELNKVVGQSFKTRQTDVWQARFYYNGGLIKTLNNTNIPIQCD